MYVNFLYVDYFSSGSTALHYLTLGLCYLISFTRLTWLEADKIWA